MFFIPGQLIAILTFPGVIAHEAGHMLFCRLKRCAVFDVCFFRVGNPAGYVVHEEPKNFSSAFWIAVGPLVVNSILCILLSFPAVIPLRIFGQPDLISYFWMCLGISIGMHAFPSSHDAQGLWLQARKAAASRQALVLLSYPLVFAIYFANAARVFWFDALYGFGLGFLLPEKLLARLVM